MKITIGGKVFEVDDATLTKALEDKTEVSIESDVVMRTAEENETFVNNLKDQQIKIGKEIGIKEFKKHVGLEVEGKDYQKVADAFKDKIVSESNISIDEKEKKWKTDLETLKNANTDLLGQVESEKKGRLGLEKTYKVKNHIDKLMPDTLTIPKEDMTLILSSKYDFDIEDGQFVAKDKMTGNVLQDSATLSPTPFDKIINGFFEKHPSYLKAAEGGNGGVDSGGAGKITVESYTKTLNEAGHTTNSADFNAKMTEAIEAGTVSMDD